MRYLGNNSVRALLLATVAPAVLGGVALGQDDSSGDDVIVVTAQKREQNLQQVPLSVTALDDERLERGDLRDFNALPTLAPNLAVAEPGSALAGAIYIRGIGTAGDNVGIEPSVGVFLDGVYLGRSSQAFTDFADLERIEVLRGPQGTLYGKNTPAGAINIVTQKSSDEWGGVAEAIYGSDNRLEGRASVSGPLADNVGIRLTGFGVRRDPTTLNIFTNREIDERGRYGFRGKLNFDFGSAGTLDIIGDVYRRDEECCSQAYIAISPARLGLLALGGEDLNGVEDTFGERVKLDHVLTQDVRDQGVSAEYNVDIANHTLTSITAWRSYDGRNDQDIDASALPIATIREKVLQKQFTQELRLTSPGEDRFRYILGFFAYIQDLDDTRNIGLGPALFGPVGTDGLPIDAASLYSLDTNSYSGFVHTTFDITDRLSVTGGLRYDTETKDVAITRASNDPLMLFPTSFQSDKRKENTVSGTGNIQYVLAEDINSYFSYSIGKKSGGYNANPVALISDAEFQEETSDTFELGLKSRLFDRLLTLNIALFYTDYTNFQAQSFDGINFRIQNVPSVTSKGVEVEMSSSPVEGLDFNLGVAYLDATYDEFVNGQCPFGSPTPSCDLSGEVLQYAPKWSGNFSAQYITPITNDIELLLRGDLTFRGSHFLSQNLDPLAFEDGYAVANLRAGLILPDRGLEFSAFLNNAFDERYLTFAFAVPPFPDGTQGGYAGTRRNWGIALKARF